MSVINKLETLENLTSVENKIVQYVLANKEEIADLTITELAKATFSSNAAIIRLCHKLGVDGYTTFKIALIKDIEKRRKIQTDVDINFPFFHQESNEDIMKRIADLSKESIDTCYESISVKEVAAIAEYIYEAKHLFLYALGDTMMSALSFSNRLIKINKRATMMNLYGDQLATIQNTTKEDVVLVVSYSGKSILSHQHLQLMKEKGTKLILITSKITTESLFDIILTFPNKEATDSKIATYYSQMSIQYIFNCLYGMLFLLDYKKNYLSD